MLYALKVYTCDVICNNKNKLNILISKFKKEIKINNLKEQRQQPHIVIVAWQTTKLSWRIYTLDDLKKFLILCLLNHGHHFSFLQFDLCVWIDSQIERMLLVLARNERNERNYYYFTKFKRLVTKPGDIEV